MPHGMPPDFSLHSPITTAATFAGTSSRADTPQVFMSDRILPDSWVSHKINGEILTDEDNASHDSFKETISSSSTTSVPMRKKVFASGVLMIYMSIVIVDSCKVRIARILTISNCTVFWFAHLYTRGLLVSWSDGTYGCNNKLGLQEIRILRTCRLFGPHNFSLSFWHLLVIILLSCLQVGSENYTASSDEIPINQNNNRPPMSVNGHNVTRTTMHPPYKLTGKNGSVCESNNTSSISGTLYSDQNERNASEIAMNAAADKGNFTQEESYIGNRTVHCGFKT